MYNYLASLFWVVMVCEAVVAGEFVDTIVVETSLFGNTDTGMITGWDVGVTTPGGYYRKIRDN